MSNLHPIVFIHGNGDNAAGWLSQINRFREKGYGDNELFAITMTPSQNETHLHYANQVKPFIDDVLQKTGAAKINVVAHSLGCTVLRYYIKFMGGAALVDKAVLIAGANHGIPACDLTLGNPDIFKQSPEVNTLNSAFLNALNKGNEGEKETYGPTEYMTISGPDDQFYFFYEDSPHLIGADNRILRGCGHFGLRSCADSFELMAAFFEGRAESVVTGREQPLIPPSRIVGTWEILAGPKKGDRYSFQQDGTYTAKDSKGIYRGTYNILSAARLFHITLNQEEGPGGKGTKLGIFRVNINDTFIRFDVGELDSKQRPEQIAFAPTYERWFAPDPIPKELLGTWIIEQLGCCAAGGWTEGQLQLSTDGKFILKGKNFLSPTGTFEISGLYYVSLASDPPRLTMELNYTDQQIPFVIVGEVLPAIFKLEGNKMRMQWGSAIFGIPRPACMDAPAVFVKH